MASATRDGRQLVAVVLGENSGGARTIRAAGLFEHGFEIYPWKAVLVPTLATWPVETPAGWKAPDLRNIVCSGAHLAEVKKGKAAQAEAWTPFTWGWQAAQKKAASIPLLRDLAGEARQARRDRAEKNENPGETVRAAPEYSCTRIWLGPARSD